jgi:hypothetical protein
MNILDETLTVIEQYRARRNERIAQATLRTIYTNSTPFADLGSLVVIECPACHSRMAFYLDFSEGLQTSLGGLCDECGAEIHIGLEYGLPPLERIDIQSVRPANEKASKK